MNKNYYEILMKHIIPRALPLLLVMKCRYREFINGLMVGTLGGFPPLAAPLKFFQTAGGSEGSFCSKHVAVQRKELDSGFRRNDAPALSSFYRIPNNPNMSGVI